ncbi:MAG: glycosyltransferase family 1 protein [Acidobacteria bacterium]|nr:glycosyltransferase family 1 protein [Acidobacteriota bacterium]MCA1640272.1 glycosyltransferase family 1 protein [Acidobacteriota bacterium]
MKIILAGIVARYPFGGVAWYALMYLLGLRALGHEVYYLEDTGECVYDYEKNMLSLDSSYGLNYINTALSQFDLGDRWIFVDYEGKYYGKTKEETREICADTDLFINLSGGCWFWRDEYQKIPHKIFIDGDPAFTQSKLAKNETWYVEFFKVFDALFTFGRNLGEPDCTIPETPFEWHKIWQPVVCEEWKTGGAPSRDVFTTVMTWKNQSFEDIDGNKDKQFAHFLDLPKKTEQPIELAVTGGHELLRSYGWKVVDGMATSRDLNKYRDYMQGSKAEFSIAKHLYVVTRSGWFSDRSECYLAAGRPVLMQETGFSKYIPTGEGLLSFNNVEEALEGIKSINSDYAKHSRKAVEIAREYFEAKIILPQLLKDTGIS